MVLFFFFLLGNIGQENVFYDILEQEKGFSTLKNKEGKKVGKLRFFQNMVFVQIWPLIHLFFLAI